MNGYNQIKGEDMGKQEILNTYKRQEDKMLLAQVLDKIKMMEKLQKIETKKL